MRSLRHVLLAVTLLGFGAGRAAAQTTYDACYVPAVGAIYLIKQAGLPTACLAQSHVAFSWTSGGTVADGSITLAKLAFDPATQAELNTVLAQLAAIGTINTSANPVDWTQLKNVPAGFADGVDAAGTGTADHGGLTGLTDDDHPQYLLGNGARTAAGGFAVSGTFGTGALAATGGGVRLLWYPRKGAFRAGAAFGTAWDDANVGDYSVAMGASPIARGNYSVALGGGSVASGDYSVAMGQGTQATGIGSTALGNGTTASGDSSTALGVTTNASGARATAVGFSTTASGPYSLSAGGLSLASGTASFASGTQARATGHSAAAIGYQAEASGQTAIALGHQTTASGLYATALGHQTTAANFYSTAMGDSSRATGQAATAMGYHALAQAYASLSIGRFNTFGGSNTGWIPTDPLLVAGNGTSDAARTNALTLSKNGNLFIAGTLTQSSDLRFKERIEPLGAVLDGVLRLQPIRYRFRENTGHPTDRQIGLGAQDVERVFPELVRRDAQGYLSVSYTQLAAVLVRAVQEQQEANEALRVEVAALRAELSALSAAVSRAERR